MSMEQLESNLIYVEKLTEAAKTHEKVLTKKKEIAEKELEFAKKEREIAEIREKQHKDLLSELKEKRKLEEEAEKLETEGDPKGKIPKIKMKIQKGGFDRDKKINKEKSNAAKREADKSKLDLKINELKKELEELQENEKQAWDEASDHKPETFQEP